MSHSTKAISSHECNFVDEARRHKRLDTFQMTVTTVITNQTLKQNPICVSLIPAGGAAAEDQTLPNVRIKNSIGYIHMHIN